MKAYKLCAKGKDGNIYPLFINKGKKFDFGEWMEAECHPPKGFALRKGFHCCFVPYAPHLKEKLAHGRERTWIEIELEDGKWTAYDRPESQGGKWILAERIKPIDIISFEEAHELAKVRKI